MLLQVELLLLVLLAVCKVVSVKQSVPQDKGFMRTRDESLPIIPACSQTLTKYHPRFAPVCCPDIPLNAMTYEHSFQAINEELDLIQWAMTPINDAFVWSTDQRSVVVETWPLLLDCKMVSPIEIE